METGLSNAQQAVLSESTRLVEACPGAGKTRAIVARFAEQASVGGRAAALLSFTNAAVDEAVTRCAHTPHATQPPNFVGTFDRFLHRFLVTPVLVRARGKLPRYVDTWSDLPASGYTTMVRHRDVGGNGLSLANFRVDVDAKLHYPEDPPQADRAYVYQLQQAGYQPADLANYAATLIKQLLDAGIYDCDFARLKSLMILRDTADCDWLHQRLATRFAEIIVDEFQDCSAIEHEILHRLQALGIRIVVVADPDQAIYEFRHADPRSYVEYRDRLTAEQIVHLDENWRSSPAICTLLSSLRSISARPIISRRDDSEAPHADVVYVVAGSAAYARAQFHRLADELVIPAQQRLVLASTRAAASALAGRPPGAGEATKLSSQLIRQVATIRFSPGATQRKQAISAIELILLGTIKFPEELKKASRSDQLDAAGIDQSQLRLMVARLVEASQAWTDATAAVASIRQTVDRLLSAAAIDHTAVALRFKTASAADWNAWQRLEAATTRPTDLPTAHIHAVKGAEFDAVLLEIEEQPKGTRPHILELWRSQETSEARRVLYVGASRARRLLVLAVPLKHLDALREVLQGLDPHITFVVEDATQSTGSKSV
jgi:DNA helicase-2/ATP-dependent DNA helicase PcrA